jgi:flagellar hook-associated protein 2
MDENTDTSRTLGGDLTLQTLESRIRNAVFQTIKTDFGSRRIGDLGLTFQRNGLLAFDQSMFQNKLDANYDEVAQIITGKYTIENGKNKGFIDHLESMANTSLSRPSGVLHTRKEGLNSQIKQIDRRITRKQQQIDRKEQMLKQKFARLEETISRIQTQGSGLAGLSAGAAGFNPVQQLG